MVRTSFGCLATFVLDPAVREHVSMGSRIVPLIAASAGWADLRESQ